MRIILFTAFLFTFYVSYAQKQYSFHVGTGSAYYMGDLSEDPGNAYWRPAAHISVSRYLSPRFSLKLGYTFGYVGADDRKSSDILKMQRALHFRSKISEFSFTGVFEFIKDKNFGNEEIHTKHVTPYAFGGISLFTFDPEAQYEGLWYPLTGDRTESPYHPYPTNQTYAYSMVLPSVPLGLGVSYRFCDALALNVEVGYRYTFTDHIDNVAGFYLNSTLTIPKDKYFADPSGLDIPGNVLRGNPYDRDSYLFGLVTLSYFFDGKGKEELPEEE
ncbi:MAG: hypothetical protein KDE26_16155 [Bacteroidetes bacterium]|nr:hypothetical protein [Bacteroidota bacterium]